MCAQFDMPFSRDAKAVLVSKVKGIFIHIYPGSIGIRLKELMLNFQKTLSEVTIFTP